MCFIFIKFIATFLTLAYNSFVSSDFLASFLESAHGPIYFQ